MEIVNIIFLFLVLLCFLGVVTCIVTVYRKEKVDRKKSVVKCNTCKMEIDKDADYRKKVKVKVSEEGNENKKGT